MAARESLRIIEDDRGVSRFISIAHIDCEIRWLAGKRVFCLVSDSSYSVQILPIMKTEQYCTDKDLSNEHTPQCATVYMSLSAGRVALESPTSRSGSRLVADARARVLLGVPA